MPEASIIIATLDRPELLRKALTTVESQSLLPHEVIVVDASEDEDTHEVVASFEAVAPFIVTYIRSEDRSAARQRNAGAFRASSPFLVFIDDDVELDRDFLRELLHPFTYDLEARVGGVSGTITNSVYTEPSFLNRVLLGLCIGDLSHSWAGRLVGPAVNFLPADTGEHVKPVEWLISGGVAYRRSVFDTARFGEDFTGYSFAEDVHLSARIAKTHVLLNTRGARFYHHDMGGVTHRDWVAQGRSMVVNRHRIMTSVLDRTSIADHLRLFAFEVLYGGLALLKTSGLRPKRLREILLMLIGKLQGFASLAISRGSRQ